MVILSVKNLTVRLDGEPVIENISFELEKGENLAVIGPNGTGKTVLIKTLLGMYPYEGEISWAKDARRGYVPQKIEADRRIPLNIQNLLEAKATILKKGPEAVKAAAKEAHLSPAALSTQVGHLSGGQFQRALIAFALLGDPNVLIFDEPTASIDEPGEEEMYELIHRLQDDLGVTAVVVSHDLSFVYRYATKVLCLGKAGLCFGDPHEVLTPQNLEQLFGSYKFYHHLHDHHE